MRNVFVYIILYPNGSHLETDATLPNKCIQHLIVYVLICIVNCFINYNTLVAVLEMYQHRTFDQRRSNMNLFLHYKQCKCG